MNNIEENQFIYPKQTNTPPSKFDFEKILSLLTQLDLSKFGSRPVSTATPMPTTDRLKSLSLEKSIKKHNSIVSNLRKL